MHRTSKSVSRSSFRRRALARLGTNLQRTGTRIRAHPAVFYTLLLAGVAAFAIAAWPFTKDHLEAIAVLQQVSGKPVPAIIGDVVAHPISTEDLTLAVESGSIRARVYLPEHSRDAPALIGLHGVHHLGIDEPRLEAFAAAMASSGIRVLTPELPDIKDYHVDSSSIRAIGEATRWFAHETGGPVGVMGLSFSGGLALVAAADPLYHPDFKFVFAVGSQDSMGRVAQYYRTGSDERPEGPAELLPAHEYGPLVLEYEYVEDFVPPPDIPAIRGVLQHHPLGGDALDGLGAAARHPAGHAGEPGHQPSRLRGRQAGGVGSVETDPFLRARHACGRDAGRTHAPLVTVLLHFVVIPEGNLLSLLLLLREASQPQRRKKQDETEADSLRE